MHTGLTSTPEVTEPKGSPMKIRHLSLAPEPAPSAPRVAFVDRDAAIAVIRAMLRKRSGKSWSVRGGRGSSWGWITVGAPPSRRGADGWMTESDRIELAELLGLNPGSGQVGVQGLTIPASSDYRNEYIARAEGREPDVIGIPYWD